MFWLILFQGWPFFSGFFFTFFCSVDIIIVQEITFILSCCPIPLSHLPGEIRPINPFHWTPFIVNPTFDLPVFLCRDVFRLPFFFIQVRLLYGLRFRSSVPIPSTQGPFYTSGDTRPHHTDFPSHHSILQPQRTSRYSKSRNYHSKNLKQDPRNPSVTSRDSLCYCTITRWQFTGETDNSFINRCPPLPSTSLWSTLESRHRVCSLLH